jgi:uncharacterized damage-inducible protein DinB
MPHPLVDQLRFTRSELQRCLAGVSEEDGQKRLLPNNSLGWIVGHLAAQEQMLWLEMAQEKLPRPELKKVRWGQSASTPPLTEMWDAWYQVTQESDPYLDSLDEAKLLLPLVKDGKLRRENLGTQMQRVIYHYWFHLGEAHALRQQMGHAQIPDFVGALGKKAPFRMA